MMREFAKALEHGFKRCVFAVASLMLRKGRRDFTVIDAAALRRVLFIRPEKLGDMIISLPVFENLKRLYPHLELYIICSPRNVAIIRGDSRLAGHFLYTKRLWRDLAALRRIRRLKADAVVDMICDDSVTALLLSQISSPSAWRIGVGKRRFRDYYDFNYEYRMGDGAHVIDNTLKLLTAFGIDTERLERHVPPTLPVSARETADRFLTSIEGAAADGIIGLNISAGRPTRVWQSEKNERLIGLLLDRFPHCRAVISADPHEHDRAVALASRFRSRVRPIPPGLDLLEVSAIISRLSLLITPDTSLVHIARAFHVPVVGLYTRFGKNYELWRPFDQDGGTVISGNDYNIFDIEVEEVFDTAAALMPTGKP